MRILSVKLNNFRCFTNLNLNFEKEQVIITGSNGSGKTSILEALYYGCYLRSFKTHITKELVKIEYPGFSVGIDIATHYGLENLNIAFYSDQKAVKLNQKLISSFKEIFYIYKVIAITEDDLQLVQSSPSFRRNFLDQTLVLVDSNYTILLRKYRQILDNRNALIYRYNGDYESYILWTNKLIEVSLIIQKKRKEVLVYFENYINNMLKDFFSDDFNFSISYLTAQEELIINSNCDFNNLLDKEKMQRRSLLGAHLDDFKIIFENKISRIYSSRGQQKLILFLLKIAQGKYISNPGHNPSNDLSVAKALAGTAAKALAKTEQNETIIFLIDDFMIDFDENKMNYLLNVVKNFASQVIITSPLFYGNALQNKFSGSESQIIDLNL